MGAWEHDLSPGSTFVSVAPDLIAEILWEYGEDELQSAALQMTARQRRELGLLAGEEYYGHMRTDKAIALAAVRVLEGRERELKRKRRRTRAGT